MTSSEIHVDRRTVLDHLVPPVQKLTNKPGWQALKALARLIGLLGFVLLPVAAHAAATLSASPTSVAPGAAVTATWSGIASPTSTDWLGMHTPSAPNTSYVTWRYTNGAASGSLPVTVPGSVAPGTYQLRLFAQNGYTLLATSNNFTVTAKISGTVTVGGSGLAGVAFTASGGTCTNSNASGQYSCDVPPGWSGSVTPSLTGYAFTPASRNYTNVTTNQTAQNYTATPTFQVSGTVSLSGSGLSGVTFTASNGGTCTTSNASGQYSCTVSSGWSGTVTPSMGSYSFSPASRNYTNVTAHQSAQDYATLTVQVSGTASVGALPLGGIAFAATNNGACTSSNTSGQYSCTVPQGWSGSVTPSLAGYSFTPGSRSHSNVTSSVTAQDFAAAVDTGTAAIYYIHTDHLGTPRVITNQPAQVLWRWDQTDPFGANAANENPSGLGTFTCNLRLPGQYFDKETNLHYNYFRDYDPAIGRYVQSDPIGLAGGINGYLYALANPLKYIDPEGAISTSPALPLPRPLPGVAPRPIPGPIDPVLPAPGKRETVDHCTRLYVRCITERWGGDWTCGQCHFYCTGINEVWPFEHCSPDLKMASCLPGGRL